MKAIFYLLLIICTKQVVAQTVYARPLALNLNNFSGSDTAYYYLSEHIEVKVVFSKDAKVKDVFFIGVDGLFRQDRIYRGGKIISFTNWEGILTGPQVMVNKKNRITAISCNKLGVPHCYSYTYYKKTNKLRFVDIYDNGVMQPCKLFFGDNGSLFLDTCDLMKGIKPCE